MPLPTWAPYDRLEADDLNAGFAWSQEATLPGAHSMTDGPTTASVASSAYGECKHGAPLALNDPLGIYRASDGRLVIPTSGIWLYRAIVRAEDSGTADAAQIHLTLDAGRVNVGSIQRRAGTQMTQAAIWLAPIVAGQVLMLECRALTSAGTFGIRTWSIVRIGRGLGAPGSPSSVSLLSLRDGLGLEALPAPDVPELEPAAAADGSDRGEVDR
jgi:hypothetical protein